MTAKKGNGPYDFGDMPDFDKVSMLVIEYNTLT
jgi:hypothetical protein